MFNLSSQINGNINPSAWFKAIRLDWAETMEKSRPTFQNSGMWAIYEVHNNGKTIVKKWSHECDYSSAFGMKVRMETKYADPVALLYVLESTDKRVVEFNAREAKRIADVCEETTNSRLH
jgi:hypothetical protein